MEQSSNPADPSAQTLGRRELLKALASSGAMAAVTLLPGGWTKPVVEVGRLPIHAQVSGVAPTPTATVRPQLSLSATSEGNNCFEITNTATVTPATAGVEILQEVIFDPATPPPSNAPSAVSAPTNGSGVATFPPITTGQSWVGSIYRLRFSFVNPQNGPATATLGPFEVAC